jgi:hypothetical protein
MRGKLQETRRSPLVYGIVGSLCVVVISSFFLVFLVDTETPKSDGAALAPVAGLFGLAVGLSTWFTRQREGDWRLMALRANTLRASVFAFAAPLTGMVIAAATSGYASSAPNVVLLANSMSSIAVLAAIPAGGFVFLRCRRRKVAMRRVWYTIVGASLSAVLLLLALYSLVI